MQNAVNKWHATVGRVGVSISEAGDSLDSGRDGRVGVCYVAFSGRSGVVSFPTHGFTLATYWSVQNLEVEAVVRACLKEVL